MWYEKINSLLVNAETHVWVMDRDKTGTGRFFVGIGTLFVKEGDFIRGKNTC